MSKLPDRRNVVRCQHSMRQPKPITVSFSDAYAWINDGTAIVEVATGRVFSPALWSTRGR